MYFFVHILIYCWIKVVCWALHGCLLLWKTRYFSPHVDSMNVIFRTRVPWTMRFPVWTDFLKRVVVKNCVGTVFRDRAMNLKEREAIKRRRYLVVLDWTQIGKTTRSEKLLSSIRQSNKNWDIKWPVRSSPSNGKQECWKVFGEMGYSRKRDIQLAFSEK